MDVPIVNLVVKNGTLKDSVPIFKDLLCHCIFWFFLQVILQLVRFFILILLFSQSVNSETPPISPKEEISHLDPEQNSVFLPHKFPYNLKTFLQYEQTNSAQIFLTNLQIVGSTLVASTQIASPRLGTSTISPLMTKLTVNTLLLPLT